MDNRLMVSSGYSPNAILESRLNTMRNLWQLDFCV